MGRTLEHSSPTRRLSTRPRKFRLAFQRGPEGHHDRKHYACSHGHQSNFVSFDLHQGFWGDGGRVHTSRDGSWVAITPNITMPLPVCYFGQIVHGTWTLEITTGNLQPSGTLNSWSISVVGPVVPQIGRFTASASSVNSGGSVTLTVSNITDDIANTNITEVAFYYLDSSGNKAILGYGTQTSPGVWTLTFNVSLTPGTYTLFAQAEDITAFSASIRTHTNSQVGLTLGVAGCSCG